MPRNVFITGVSSGIGLALAKVFLGQGAHVFGVSRREPTELHGRPGFYFRSVDLSRLEQISPALQQLLEPVEKLDLAVLNAGVLGTLGDLRETPVDDMRAVMNVNVWANKVIVDSLVATGKPLSQVVGISSGAGTKANRGWNSYSISKAALNMLMALYAAELPGTHFSALSPGIVETAMQEKISSLPHDPRFTSLEMLRQAKGTEIMPKPDLAASRLVVAMDKALKYPSGSFLDINTLVKRNWSLK